MSDRVNVLATVITNPDSVPPLTMVGDVPFAVQDDAYKATIRGVGGAGGYSYTVNSKPSWLTAATVGSVLELTGTVPYAGDGDIHVTVTDALLNTSDRTFRVNVGGTIRPPYSGGGQVRTFNPITIETIQGGDFLYDVVAACSGVTLPIIGLFQTDGTLPGHTAVDDVNGLIQGNGVTAPGTFLFSLRLQDGGGQVLDIPFKVIVRGVVDLTSDLPDAMVGQSYAGSISATGGSGDYSYEVTAGALPDGLILERKTGRFHPKGLPTTPSPPDTPSTFTVTATDAYGNNASLACEITVAAATRLMKPGRVLMGNDAGENVEVDLLSAFFGDGSDGDLIIDGAHSYPFLILSSGENVPQRDIYARSITFLAGGKLAVANGTFRIYCSEFADFENAPANALSATGRAGNAVSGPGAGSLFGTSGTSGGSGATGNGSPSSSSNGFAAAKGGRGGQGGNGGNGTGGRTGGVAALPGAIAVALRPIALTSPDLYIDSPAEGVINTIWIGGGIGGTGGGGGAGTGTNAGTSGARAGAGGDVITLFARSIRRGASTAAGAIQAKGGIGANATNAGTSGTGGGGGAGGGGGGGIRIVCLMLEGTPATNMVDASGGNAGNGGNGSGVGTAGQGGDGGDGGSIVIQVLAEARTESTIGATGSVNSGQAGGAGGLCRVTL